MFNRSRRTALLRRLPMVLPAVLAACSGPRSPLPPVGQVVEQLQPLYLDTDETNRRLTTCLAMPLGSQRDCRDTIVQALMVAIDVRYAEYERDFFDANRAVGFGSSVAVLGLGSAGALAATGTAQVLNAISAAVTGTREAFGREMMAEQTAAALLTAMRNGRNQVRLRIQQGLGQDARAYPLGIALSDLQAYFRAGTMPGALSSLTEIVGTQARLTAEELRSATPVATTNVAVCLTRLLGDRNLTPPARAANRQRMRAAMTAAGVGPTVEPEDFVIDARPAAAAQHRAVAAAMGCPQ